MTANATFRAQSAPTLEIFGSGFNATVPSNNTVLLNKGAAGQVNFANSTYILFTFTDLPTSTGDLNAVVFSGGKNSSTPTKVATVVPAPQVAPSKDPLLIGTNQFTIAGTDFDGTPQSDNTVFLSSGAVGVVTAATANLLTVTLTTQPANVGPLFAVVTSFGGPSGSPVQVADVV